MRVWPLRSGPRARYSFESTIRSARRSTTLTLATTKPSPAQTVANQKKSRPRRSATVPAVYHHSTWNAGWAPWSRGSDDRLQASAAERSTPWRHRRVTRARPPRRGTLARSRARMARCYASAYVTWSHATPRATHSFCSRSIASRGPLRQRVEGVGGEPQIVDRHVTRLEREAARASERRPARSGRGRRRAGAGRSSARHRGRREAAPVRPR